MRVLNAFHLDFRWPDDALAGGLPFSKLATQADRAAALADETASGRYDVRRDLEFVPLAPGGDEKGATNWLRDQKLKFREGPTGFFVGAEVERVGTRFRLREPLGGALDFLIKIRNPRWLDQTNHALGAALPLRYFFTNGAAASGLVLPSLARQSLPFSANRIWEMGAVADDSGTAKKARRTTNELADFENLTAEDAAFRFATEADRVGLPRRFRYLFPPDLVLKKVRASLRQPVGGAEIAAFEADFSGKKPRDWPLDFSKNTPDGAYELQIENDEQPLERREIWLFDALDAASDAVGFLRIDAAATGEAGRDLFEGNGLLRQPVFELRFMARPAHWQFFSKKPLPTVSGFSPFDGDSLVSDAAFSMSAARQLLAGGEKLPNPPPSAGLRLLRDGSPGGKPFYAQPIFI